MPRAIWKGAISFGLIHIPVDLFSAENSQQLDLDMLDKRDFSPVGYKRYNKTNGKDVEWADIVKGYEFEENQYVVLSDEDIKRANPEATQTIDILSFIEAKEISPIYFEQPYYLTPGKGGEKVYALLRETLRKSGKIAIAQVVIRVKQHLAALIPIDDMIVLNLLRYVDDIHPMGEYKVPSSSKQFVVSAKEVQMALSLVEGMTEKWDPASFKDNYKNDLLKLIQKRIKSKQTKVLDESEPPESKTAASNIVDIMALLKQSIESKSVKPLTGKDKTAKPKKAA